MIEKIVDRIDDFFYTYIYWRVKDWIYRFKCFVWHRYTTTKPRYLDHTWCDISHLLVHTSFELLLRFYEQEMYEYYTDWDYDEYHRNARDKIEYLVDWYINDFIPYDNWENQKIMFDLQPEPITSFWDTDERGYLRELEFDNEDDELFYHAINQAVWDYEARMEQEIEDNLKLLAEVRPYLWT